jgi:hypothetical protein
MEFREYASHETSTVIARLLASQAEAQVQRARDALDAAARALATTGAPVGAEDEARDLVQRLEAAAGIAVQRVQQDAQKAADALRDELAAARRVHEAAARQIESLRGELAGQADRATTAEADLDATIEAHRQLEAELGGLRELLDGARREASRQATELEAENAQRAILTADLAAAAENQARLEGDLAAARAAAAEEADQRATLEAELEAARGTLALLEEARATLVDDLDAARTEADGNRADADAIRAELETSRAEIETTRADRDRARGETLTVRKELERVRAAGDAARSDLDAAHAGLGAAHAELGAARDALAAASARTPLVASAASACRALGPATSIADLLGALATAVSAEFDRAAIFRVKAQHLEGEHAVGFDAATDVSKLVIPLALDALVTRAHGAGAMLTLGPGDAAASAPFGGEPHLAVAVPLAVQGEPIAVLYADAADPSAGACDERPAFAAVLAEHASALLARMSQELKTLHELGDYATLLLQEAEQMYAADVEAGRSDAERRNRLKDTLECARQLYAQRAALEGAAAAGLLDEQLAAAAAGPTPFARDLAAVASTPSNRQVASRAS